ncbi:hypothetical protein CY35_05G023900 [Sphagnum magellanicum]|nr:hypothetical protein CY35_05G023900 [Sphagnum magellanicum]
MGQQPQQQHVETTCGSLLRELQNIWDEVGENDLDRDKMLLQLEQECLEVYRRKVDHASQARAQLHQDLANTEAELAALFSALGDPAVSPREKRTGTLREQLATIRPQVEALRQKKEDRAKQFLEVKTQIANICGEIAATPAAGFYLNGGDQDMSLRKLEEYNSQLQVLQQERSDRLHKVLEYMNAARELCTLLGMDFTQIIADVHPSLVDSNGGQPKSISNGTIAQLAKTIHSLREEKKLRLQKLRDLGMSLIELWNLMDTPLEDQQSFQHITCNIAVTEEDITLPGSLALGIIDQAEIEVARLDTLKASKMKELVVKRRMELEEVCRCAHIEPDASTMEDKLIALIDSGEVDPSDLLSNLEEQITQAKHEASKRKEILEKMEKWMSACEEEGWLEDYNKDENRFASKGAHLNLKRAERARAAINKLPALVESLNLRTKAWEEEQGIPFLFDGVRLLAMLDEYNYLRQEKEEEKRRLRDQKKLQEQMMNEKETLFGSKPSPIKAALSSKKANGVSRTSVGGTGSQVSRRLSLGSAIMQPGTESPQANAKNGSRLTGKHMKQEHTRPKASLNLNKDELPGVAPIGGSAPTSPRDV